MPEMPEGLDRDTLVVVRPKDGEGAEFTVGVAYLRRFADEVEFVRYGYETPEQAAEREKKDAAPATAPKSAPVDRFAQ